MIATVNSVVGGSVVALLLGRVADAPLGWAAVAGAVAAAVSLLAHRRWDQALHRRSGGYDEVMFPSS
jgi:uncharacterized membrane protein YccC